MFTKYNALLAGILLILLFTSACGAAATPAPSTQVPSDYEFYNEPAAT